jgi:hypothetical protein
MSDPTCACCAWWIEKKDKEIEDLRALCRRLAGALSSHGECACDSAMQQQSVYWCDHCAALTAFREAEKRWGA